MKRIEVVQPALNQLLAFTLDERRYALGLSAVERIVRMVEVTRVPGMPEIVMGVIDWQGKIIPVLNVRKRFALPEREPDWNDHLIIARTATRTVSLAVDSVTGVIARRSEEITPPETIAPGIGYVTGVTKLEGDILFVHDLDRFLSLQEEATLNEVRAGR